MLKQRVITAVVLLALLLPALFYASPEPFCLLVLVLIGAGAWEWGRLNGQSGLRAWALALVCVLACLAAWAAGWMVRPMPLLWTVAGAAWVGIGAWLLHRGVDGWARVPVALRLVGGLLALSLAWLAAAQARVIGINFLLSVLVLVWVADIGAYFAGRAFGTRFTRGKLAPSISPGKSWEGVWGGMVGVLVLAGAWVWADAAARAGVGSLYTRLYGVGAWLLVIAVLFLAAMSVVGDLVESLIKRSAGVKDSSGLLPGHGGVLDRVDALLPALPLAMMLASLAQLLR
ncbi:MAG: phosphatidate cytidylyltransferase [Burkholderiaceae bacterium]|nr:phosphatidate cytidylyltransferase [Burkholderiaceae bacterium]